MSITCGDQSSGLGICVTARRRYRQRVV